MLTIARTLSVPVLVVITSLLMQSCENSEVGSLYDPNAASPRPQPTVTSISPASGLAGVTTITINGTNFSAVKEENTVYFDKTTAVVLTASATQLTVKAPLLAKDSIQIRVGVFGSDLYSTTRLYKLEAAVVEFGSIAKNEEAFGVAADANGTVYVGLMTNAVDGSIIRINPVTGVRQDLAAAVAQRRYIALKASSDSYLYALLEGSSLLLRVPLAGGAVAPYAVLPGLTDVADFDFDATKNIWIGSRSANVIGRVTPAKVFRTFPLNMVVRSVRVFNSGLYVAGAVDTVEGVWRAEIVSADSLGSFKKYFDLRTLYSTKYQANALTFSSDGWLYLGTSSPDGIVLVAPGGTSGTPYYETLFKNNVSRFGWGAGPVLFATRPNPSGTTGNSVIYYINTQKTSSPYHGLQ